MDTPLVFRVPRKKTLLKTLSRGGFSFLKCNENMVVAYQKKHWNKGKVWPSGIALRSDIGLKPISEQANVMLNLYTEAPDGSRRDFLKKILGLLASMGLNLKGKKSLATPADTTDVAYYADSDTFDTSDGGYYYTNSTSDMSPEASYYGVSNEGLSVIIDLDDLNDVFNRHLAFGYERAIMETVKICQETVSDGKENVTLESLSSDLNESRTHDGRVKILLDENEHVEWSVMHKLVKSFDSHVTQRAWTSPIEKVDTLCKEAKGGLLRAISANEALTVGGNKHLMWVDIDSTDVKGIREWLDSQPFFSSDSYVCSTSTTGKCHLYIATDKPLKERWQRGMRKMLRESMPIKLAHKLDRVYGPESHRAIFLPRVSLTSSTYPQKLTSKLEGKFELPVSEIEHCLWKKNS